MMGDVGLKTEKPDLSSMPLFVEHDINLCELVEEHELYLGEVLVKNVELFFRYPPYKVIRV